MPTSARTPASARRRGRRGRLALGLAGVAAAWLAIAGAVSAAAGVGAPPVLRPSPRGLVLWRDPSTQAAAALVGHGERISAKLAAPRPFVVDVGRNGLGPAAGPLAWCNPPGRALGAPTTTQHPEPLVDALLWIKPPGESDGVCRPGKPPAGEFRLD